MTKKHFSLFFFYLLSMLPFLSEAATEKFFIETAPTQEVEITHPIGHLAMHECAAGSLPEKVVDSSGRYRIHTTHRGMKIVGRIDREFPENLQLLLYLTPPPGAHSAVRPVSLSLEERDLVTGICEVEAQDLPMYAALSQTSLALSQPALVYTLSLTLLPE